MGDGISSNGATEITNNTISDNLAGGNGGALLLDLILSVLIFG